MTENEKRIQAAKVLALCGDISQMTLWRWMRDPALNFPKPVYIGNRRYWREADVIEWLESQNTEAA
ncbi:helix-turn-helix transcriptional regulator [Roseovarius indicus]|uniref:Prophage CP4-57 regulatory n=1 Tax=Roseovarius indicus TaxID=540747 RepID=A0A0T5PAT7_9RHOB|nr:AlpA family phage regulatory protein [Roseovarius indicus]KRS18229.1 prophage CP4-57 regulatory [Roseovarius indicus]QEW26938.1 putative transcriptional regulator [Roseovarius indicus]SFD57453.1 transcriptional regulator, AlpA family [Roseovarius indicus]